MKNFDNITVLLQGPITKGTTKAYISNIKKVLPGAKIILSTWEGQENVEVFNDIEILFNKDPGATILDKKTGQLNNINRQIISTVEGLKKVTTPLVLKIRSDIIIEHADFLNYFSLFKNRDDEFTIFKERLLICEKFCRPSSMFPYHISDWFIFGYTTDLLKLFDIPLEPRTDDDWFYKYPLTLSHKIGYFQHFRHRYCAEQYIWYNCISKYHKIKFEHMCDVSNDNIKLSNLYLINNFVILPQQILGFNFKKFPSNNNSCLLSEDWLFLYNSHFKTEIELTFKAGNYLEAQKESIKHDIKLQIINFRNLIKELFKNSKGFSLSLRRYLFVKLFPKFAKVNINKNGHFYSLFGKNLYSFIRNNNSKEISVLFLPKRKEASFQTFVRELALEPSNIQLVAVLEIATGETVALVRNLNQIIPNPEDTLFLFFRKSSWNIFNFLTSSKYKTKLIPKSLHSANDYKILNQNYFTYINSYCFFYIFPSIFWNNFHSGSISYINYCKEKLGSDFSKLGKLDPTDCDVLWAKDFLNKNNLTPKNFILFLPEASSVQEFSSNFWTSLFTKTDYAKFPVIENRVLNQEGSLDFSIKLACNFGKLFALATLSEKIVMLRSGMSEFLSMSGTNIDIYYPLINRGNPSISDLFKLYTMKQFKCESSINEFIVDSVTEEILISN